MKFAHAAFDEDPEKDQTTHDIILWSGLSPYVQTHFAPEKFKNGETALLLGNMWVSDLLTKIPTFEWGNEDCKDKIKTFRGNTSPADGSVTGVLGTELPDWFASGFMHAC